MANHTPFPCDIAYIRARPADAVCERTARPWVLAATILGSSLVFIDGATVTLALPALQRTLGATVADIQWIVNIYTLFLASLLLLGGSLGDHFGRRRVFVAGTILFTLSSVAAGLATGTQSLIVARAAQGIGAALLTPGSLAIISASFPHEERGRAIGLWSALTALAMVVGPLIGGRLIDTASWRWIFFMPIPTAVAVVVLALRFVPESRDEEANGPLDWTGALLATVGLGCLTYGLIEASGRGFGDGAVLVSLIGGALLLAAFVAFEARTKSPMLPPALFRSRTFTGSNLLTVLLYAALGGALFFLPLKLIQVHGYSAVGAAAANLPFLLTVSVLGRWAGGLAEKVGARLPVALGPTLVAVGFVLLGIPYTDGSYWTTFFPALLLLGLGMALNIAPLTMVVLNAVPDHLAGTASGINNAASRVAGLLAVAVFGIVMVATFGASLDISLAKVNIAAEEREAIFSQTSALASLAIPETLSVEMQRMVREEIHRAFGAGFRMVTFLAALLALASAVVGWVTISGQAPAGDDEATG